MNLVNEVKEYTQYVKQNSYIYSLQQQGLELFLTFIMRDANQVVEQSALAKVFDYFLAFWVPRNKKYLAEVEAFNIVYTVQDLQVYINNKYNKAEESPIILDLYGEEYMRMYKTKKLLREMIGDPIVSMNPTIISLENYRQHKQKQQKKDSMSVYEQGLFQIDEINKEGYIVLSKVNAPKFCKVLFRPSLIYNFKEKDVLQVSLRRKIFFIYWELEEVKAYYPAYAKQYL